MKNCALYKGICRDICENYRNIVGKPNSLFPKIKDPHLTGEMPCRVSMVMHSSLRKSR
jgi:hypothetical protein